MAAQGLVASDTDYDRYAAINLALWKQFEKGEIEKETILTKRFRDYTARYAVPAEPDRLNEDYKKAISHQNILMPHALEVLTALKARGWDVIPSESNFVFARPPKTQRAAKLFADLKAKNIFVRYFKGKKTGDRLRITIGTDAQMKKLTKAIDELNLR